ncbi:hypothetical protein ACFX11_044369 [Malus domestica]
MAGAASNDQALSLLATVNNHGDLAVKLSSLKQAKDLLLSLEPSVNLFLELKVCGRDIYCLPCASSLRHRSWSAGAQLIEAQLQHPQKCWFPFMVVPENDGLALKKITDACSACFEQRTVFTQALAKALNQMVDQTPLPLLFMRTVIQAIDDFPSLVDFVMEILSKLVRKQLPPPQLESTLNKYANLRGPFAAYASQPSVKASLYRPTLADLGLENETHLQQPHVPPSLYLTDTSSSVHGADSNVIITKQHKLINSWSNSYVIIRKRSDSQK